MYDVRLTRQMRRKVNNDDVAEAGFFCVACKRAWINDLGLNDNDSTPGETYNCK